MEKVISWTGEGYTETLTFTDEKIVRIYRPYNRPIVKTVFISHGGELKIVEESTIS